MNSVRVAFLLLSLGIHESIQLDVCESLAEGPSLTFDMELKNQVVRRGDSIELVCAVYGAPQATITWYRNGIPLRVDEAQKSGAWAGGAALAAIEGHEARRLGAGLVESRLNLPCVDTRAAGLYTCRAHSPCPIEPIQSDALIAIDNEKEPLKTMCPRTKPSEQTPPRIITSTLTRLEFAGNTVQLMCRAAGRPSPSIRWQRIDDEGKAHDLENDAQFMALPNGDLLVLGDDKAVASMAFRCVASNPLGEATSDTTIIFVTDDLLR